MGRWIGRKTAIAGIVVLFAVAVRYYQSQKTLTPVLEISTGKLQGLVSYTRGGKEVHEYLQVPYAKPPVGDLRFAPPEPVQPWKGLRDASQKSPSCIQVNLITSSVDGQEDCLFLNVYTPAKRQGPLPVMVFFHGGAFIFGTSSSYKGAYLLDQDIVLVTVNYRLASLGFLSTGDNVVRGNMGLKDQNMALKWVQENIQYFGGDHKQITIFGESAGSASVGFHLISPMSKGLFKRAIMQSGSPLGNWAINREPAKQARRFAAKFNCTGGSEEIISCLRKIDSVTLVEAHKEVLIGYFYKVALREQITLFVPTIETIQDSGTFLGEEPLESLMSGRVNKIPLIIGANRDEGLLSSAIITANHTKLRQANNEWDFWAARVLGYDMGKHDVSAKIRKFYFGNAADIGSIEFLPNFTRLFSDRQFFVPIHRFAQQFGKFADTRMYLYTYEAEFCFADILAATQSEWVPPLISVIWEVAKRWICLKFGYDIPHLGICHADELQLLFNWQLSPYIGTHHRDAEMSRQMVKLWTDFAKGEDSLSIHGVTWSSVNPKVASVPLQYLSLNSNPKMEDESFTDRINFWNGLGV